MTATKLVRGLILGVALVACPVLWGAAYADPEAVVPMSKGQVVYVPVYSHIYIGDRERPFLLAVTLSVRNTDRAHSISVQNVVYYDSNGRQLKDYLKTPLRLEKLSATRFVVDESDASGGSGASFMVEWTSEQSVTPPIVETVMIGAQTQQGISFTSRGRVLEEK